ncbi:interleukin 2 receptor, gamma a isoform X2 [Sphaeramia orbicularis]|uniref:interleukin 2 receptor, gamma a isoform X2 n=1 Tax=Sphaeramia orbicularis TaxID=375764 RepID=UPI00117EA059|nr:cytokine receptor common subunit gamma-like isoform X2 [Sphaeramia orbicularis]
MATSLLLILCLLGHAFANKSTDVDCMVINLDYVNCTWNAQGTPDVNYTFHSRFHFDTLAECANYMTKNGMNIGCQQPSDNLRVKRFDTFYTVLEHGNNRFSKEHDLKTKVKLNPPTNLTVQNNSDSNLCFKWKQITHCVESEVRYRINYNKWDTSKVSSGRTDYYINLPSSNSRYELQVRSRIDSSCGESDWWSDWSEPVVWGSNNSTDSNRLNGSMNVWTPVVTVVGALILILLVMMLLHYERFRILIIPVVPKPSLVPKDIQEWLNNSKDLKDVFKPNYNERACPVREYCQLSQSDSESSDSSNFSVTTDQTDCSVSMPTDESGDVSTPCSSSSTSAVFAPNEERPISV